MRFYNSHKVKFDFTNIMDLAIIKQDLTLSYFEFTTKLLLTSTSYNKSLAGITCILDRGAWKAQTGKCFVLKKTGISSSTTWMKSLVFCLSNKYNISSCQALSNKSWHRNRLEIDKQQQLRWDVNVTSLRDNYVWHSKMRNNIVRCTSLCLFNSREEK